MSELLTEDLAPLDALSLLLRGYAQRQPLEAAEVEVLYDLIAARHAIDHSGACLAAGGTTIGGAAGARSPGGTCGAFPRCS